MSNPNKITIKKVLKTQPTTAQLAKGVSVENTVLGDTLSNTVKLLGGKPVAYTWGQNRSLGLFIEATIKY